MWRRSEKEVKFARMHLMTWIKIFAAIKTKCVLHFDYIYVDSRSREGIISVSCCSVLEATSGTFCLV